MDRIDVHMEVRGSDGEPVGVVDGRDGQELLKLTRDGPRAEGDHHWIPIKWVDHVEGNSVILKCTGREARENWQVTMPMTPGPRH